MQQTTNYKLNKIELADSPADITVLNSNWDKIDTELKKLTDEKFNKTGGEVSGKVTITKNGLKVTGGSETDTINVTENGEVGGTLTVSGKVTANGGLDVVGGIVNDGEYKLKVDITKGQTPSKAKYATIGIYDNSLSEGYRLGRIQYGISTNNTASMAMYVNRPNDAESEDSCGLLAQWLNGTTARISVTHHPETASNDKSVATTYWVRNLKATASQYGLIKLADETAILNESDESALTVDKAYELNDFRRMETAYSVGDKVHCAFKFEYYLECTKAGTTSANTLDTRNVWIGQVITDGTCQWTVRAHVKSVDGVVPDKDGNVRCIYRSVESLGLSQNTNTIIDVYKALPNNGAIFFDYINGANVESFGVPTNGVLKILKDNGIGCAYLNKYAGTTEAWYANFSSSDTIDTIKWQKIVTTESLQNDIKSTVLDIFFPVGSIYMDATGNVNPNTQFGGSWAKIENAFLYASGSKSVGTTGGSETVTLTRDQMPKHGHSRGTMNIQGQINTFFGESSNPVGTIRHDSLEGALYPESRSGKWPSQGENSDAMAKYLKFRADRSWGGTTTEVGGGEAHDNMPPYRVVAVWRRTA